jgi:hypothetical protein
MQQRLDAAHRDAPAGAADPVGEPPGRPVGADPAQELDVLQQRPDRALPVGIVKQTCGTSTRSSQPSSIADWAFHQVV